MGIQSTSRLLAALSVVAWVAASGCSLKRNLAYQTRNGLASVPDPIYAPALLYTDGEVKTLAADAGKLYMGGHFKHVGPYTRSGPTVDLASGNILSPSLKFEVSVIEPDGSGGYYIAGAGPMHETAAAANTPGIAHVLSDGAVDANFAPRFDGNLISGLKLVGNRLFVSGAFNGVYVGATLNPRGNLAALDASTGALLSYRYDVQAATTLLLAHSGNTLYIEGAITDVDPGGSGTWTTLPTATWGTVIAIDDTSPATGIPAWISANNNIFSIQVVGDELYIGGTFSQVSSSPRMYLAAIDISTPASLVLLGEDPLAAAAGYTFRMVASLASDGTSLYVTGAEGSTPALSRTFVGKITAGSADWITSALGTTVAGLTSVVAVSPAGDLVYAAINNVNVTTQHVEVKAFDPITGAASDLSFGDHPRLRVKSGDGESCFVAALATSPGKLHLGGHFISIVQERHSIAQIDLETGLPTSWDADLQTNKTVYSIAAKNGSVYFGGDFTKLHNSTTPVTRHRLAAMNASDGTILPWNPDADDDVYKVYAIKNSVIAMGLFEDLGGDTRSRIGVLDATTGLVDESWDPGYVYGGVVNQNGVVQSTVVGNDLYFAAVDDNWSMGGAGTSQAAVYRLSFNDGAAPAVTAYWPFMGSGQFNLSGLPDQSGILVTGLISEFDNQLVSTSFDSFIGIKGSNRNVYSASSVLSSSWPLTSMQMQVAMDGMVRRGWAQKDRLYLGGYANEMFGGVNDTWGLAVINLTTGAVENPAAGATLPTFQLLGDSSSEDMGIVNDVLTIGNTTYVAGTFYARLLPGMEDPATQTPHILTLKDGVWIEP